jgi:hypothetical protein
MLYVCLNVLDVCMCIRMYVCKTCVHMQACMQCFNVRTLLHVCMYHTYIRMYVCMNGCMDGWMDGWMDVSGCMYHTYIYMSWLFVCLNALVGLSPSLCLSRKAHQLAIHSLIYSLTLTRDMSSGDPFTSPVSSPLLATIMSCADAHAFTNW